MQNMWVCACYTKQDLTGVIRCDLSHSTIARQLRTALSRKQASVSNVGWSHQHEASGPHHLATRDIIPRS
jgi:hypothetical protein